MVDDTNFILEQLDTGEYIQLDVLVYVFCYIYEKYVKNSNIEANCTQQTMGIIVVHIFNSNIGTNAH